MVFCETEFVFMECFSLTALTNFEGCLIFHFPEESSRGRKWLTSERQRYYRRKKVRETVCGVCLALDGARETGAAFHQSLSKLQGLCQTSNEIKWGKLDAVLKEEEYFLFSSYMCESALRAATHIRHFCLSLLLHFLRFPRREHLSYQERHLPKYHLFSINKLPIRTIYWQNCEIRE